MGHPFCLQQKSYPRVGYVEEKQLLALGRQLLARKPNPGERQTSPLIYTDDTDQE
jgi:hypothetical protein